MKTFEEIKNSVALKYVKPENNYTLFQIIHRDYSANAIEKIYKEVCELYCEEKIKAFKNIVSDDLKLIQKNFYAKNFIQEIVYKLLIKIK